MLFMFNVNNVLFNFKLNTNTFGIAPLGFSTYPHCTYVADFVCTHPDTNDCYLSLDQSHSIKSSAPPTLTCRLTLHPNFHSCSAHKNLLAHPHPLYSPSVAPPQCTLSPNLYSPKTYIDLQNWIP